MKVVLFCGGQGLRMREASETLPKPMVTIGGRPVLWHVMKYFAHFGHTDFVLCLGHGAEVIKRYFLTYNEALSNDFVLSDGGRNVELLGHDIHDWSITFVDTGRHSTIGERLLAVRPHLEGADYFLANYGDTLTDAAVPELVRHLQEREAVASFLSIRPNYSFHVVEADDSAHVKAVRDTSTSDIWINGGYFVLRRDVFDYLRPGEELVGEAFQRLIDRGLLVTYRHEGFWAPMDTLKDRQILEQMLEAGNGPWRVWEVPARSEAVANGGVAG
jgi:glucose-1-phosphate cytidylyltransferase